MTTPPLKLPLHMRRNGLDPVEELARAREDEGVVPMETPCGPPEYLICRHEDVRQVLADPGRFSSALAPLPGFEYVDAEELERLRAGQLFRSDPPEHTRLRRMLTPEFTMRRMRELEPRITQIVHTALDDLERAGKPADLVEHFALPVPSLVICELLGVPYADHARFQQCAVRLLDTSLPMEQRVEAQRENRAYMAGLVARAQAGPGQDMLGMLVREHGDDLSTDELIGIAELLLLAGHETTSNMLALGALALLRHPDQLAMIRQDLAQAEPAVEELLRWLSVVHAVPPRMTTTEVEIAGHAIPSGSLVTCSLPAANRDPALVHDPETLDVTRAATGHLAFGHGVHHCLGAPLARMEMRIAFPALLRRFPGLALADPNEQADFRVSTLVYGVNALRVTW
ncbi:cytochrome P450 [Sphaerisporangium siamense]|uniref:Cytochrome P450 n=1 Tax=Sphaerisporangium siamense TaxID=795645 RepID=A0A7W7GBV5_9ACTN|nr:cytochrome P450 [Sphaerisporangium siamense]MBB4703882.1 cytochrome P450 [Sphaerisporangium siamense]GII82351.1 cytochrome P450 [Sphaerisporangium siamense]